MSFTDHCDPIYEAIRSFLESNWHDCPIRWPNSAFTIPNGPWLDVEITGTVFAQQSIGAEVASQNRWDEAGTVYIHVLTPAGLGSSQTRGAAKAVAQLFRGLTLMDGSLEFQDASVGLGEPGETEGAAYRVTVAVDWVHRDD